MLQQAAPMSGSHSSPASRTPLPQLAMASAQGSAAVTHMPASQTSSGHDSGVGVVVWQEMPSLNTLAGQEEDEPEQYVSSTQTVPEVRQRTDESANWHETQQDESSSFLGSHCSPSSTSTFPSPQ